MNSNEKIWLGVAIGVGAALAIGMVAYQYYKSREHEAYLKWRTEMLGLNQGIQLPQHPPWEFAPGQGPNAMTFYL